MNDVPNATTGMRQVEARLGRPVADYLRDAYQDRGLPQTTIAEELGIDPATVSRWMARFGIRARVIGPRKRRA